MRALCLPEGDDGFAYHRFDAAQPDLRALAEAVNSLPFTTERTLVEVRGFDLNRCRDSEASELERIVSDIPDYCTLVFVLSSDYEPDMRLKAAKLLCRLGRAVDFTPQGQGQLMNWIRKRFAALDKDVGPEACAALIMTSGELMNGLIPEIAKLASGTEGEEVTAADVRRLASRYRKRRPSSWPTAWPRGTSTARRGCSRSCWPRTRSRSPPWRPSAATCAGSTPRAWPSTRAWGANSWKSSTTSATAASRTS